MNTSSDQQHPIGSLEWASNNSGALLAAEKKSLLTPIIKTAVELVLGGLLYKLGLYPNGTGKIDLESITVPDSKIAREAEQECLSKLSPEIITHSLRTFVFGMALSQVEEVYKKLDIEHFYVTSLLHDIDIESNNTNNCFAVSGGQQTSLVAHRSGKSEKISKDLGNAISQHITPGVNKAYPGSLAALISEASLLDLSGYKIWKLDQDFVKDVDKNDWTHIFKENGRAQLIAQLPSHTTQQSRLFLANCWNNRALAFPHGRVALLENVWPGLSHFIRCKCLR
ncbi:hypothetical protein IQ260_07165 [Leptolyngbya cf. ectocarpi LEGE 11479]|uniref:HD domain-containing protein n=1 Tax=Leptolyngbya cf. ectocarpi LEGE 11479 TaxID=1828722 RepID=A0A928WZV8_LEPEC|nr:hypothetical protein [Leptolyngbya ectocarpi]MBE9066429.1 hypothetical protein [Leptolyngbya cf. ectocarpi LEGE 11479]